MTIKVFLIKVVRFVTNILRGNIDRGKGLCERIYLTVMKRPNDSQLRKEMMGDRNRLRTDRSPTTYTMEDVRNLFETSGPQFYDPDERPDTRRSP